MDNLQGAGMSRHSQFPGVSLHFSVVHWLWLLLWGHALGRMLTSARGRGDADADKVLEGDDTSQEAAVLGPDLRNGFSSASIQDTDQPTGVNHGVEVHSLSNDIHGH